MDYIFDQDDDPTKDEVDSDDTSEAEGWESDDEAAPEEDAGLVNE